MFKRLLTALFCCALCLTIKAQVANQPYIPNSHNSYTAISVNSEAGDEPLVGATIRIICKGDTLISVAERMNFQVPLAVYYYNKIPSDSVELIVSYVGYKTFKRKYSVLEFKGIKRVALADDEKMISQIIVQADRIAMVIKGDTTIYNAASFKTLEGDKFKELLKQLPGVEVREGKIYASGEEIKRVYVDGRNFFGENPEYSLSDVTADNVKSVKVYDQQSASDKYLGKNDGKNEKVMDIVTKNKPKIIKGGNARAIAGYGLDDNVYGGEKLRYQGALGAYRNHEKGNQRLELGLAKNTTSKMPGRVAAFDAKPTSSQKIALSNSLRRGDSLTFSNALTYDNTVTKSLSEQYTEYFPNDIYNIRNNRATAIGRERLSRVGLSTLYDRKRGGHVVRADLRGSLNFANNTSQSITSQNLDNTYTTLDSRSSEKVKGGSVAVGLNNDIRLSKKSQMLIYLKGEYSRSNSNQWTIDTLASNPLMRLDLNNDTNSDKINADITVRLGVSLAEKCTWFSNYALDYRNDRSRRTSVDFINNPSGDLDSVNSYNYTVNSVRNSLSSAINWRTKKDISFYLGFRAQQYGVISDERIPDYGRRSRDFYSLLPDITITTRKPHSNISLSVQGNASDISLEELRSGLDATDPLYLRSGNPSLKQTKNYNSSLRYSYTDAKRASSYIVMLSGNMLTDYKTNKTTVFTSQTYLPQYGYTAQSGSQLTEMINTSGCYGWRLSATYSKRLKIKWTLKTTAAYTFNRTPYYMEQSLLYSKNRAGSLTVNAISGFSTKINIEINSLTQYGAYTTLNQNNRYFSENIDLNLRAIILRNYTLNLGTAYYHYSNKSFADKTTNDIVANLEVGRKFGKERKLELSVGVVDIFNRVTSIRTVLNNESMRTTSNALLGRYGFIGATYMF